MWEGLRKVVQLGGFGSPRHCRKVLRLHLGIVSFVADGVNVALQRLQWLQVVDGCAGLQWSSSSSSAS